MQRITPITSLTSNTTSNSLTISKPIVSISPISHPVTRISTVNTEKERARIQYLNMLKNSNDMNYRYLYTTLMESSNKNTYIDTLVKSTNFRIS